MISSTAVNVLYLQSHSVHLLKRVRPVVVIMGTDLVRKKLQFDFTINFLFGIARELGDRGLGV